jgi:hypothetical protein
MKSLGKALFFWKVNQTQPNGKAWQQMPQDCTWFFSINKFKLSNFG